MPFLYLLPDNIFFTFARITENTRDTEQVVIRNKLIQTLKYRKIKNQSAESTAGGR